MIETQKKEDDDFYEPLNDFPQVHIDSPTLTVQEQLQNTNFIGNDTTFLKYGMHLLRIVTAHGCQLLFRLSS